jgi:predicted O-methyltransferase YrrM
MFNLTLLALLLVALVLLGYQIRLSRKFGAKLNQLMNNEKQTRKNSRELKISTREDYRQSEFYAQLLHLLNLDAPIPPTRGWAASPDVLLTLVESARSSEVRTIVDLGSGVSTLVLAKSSPRARVVSIDNSGEYAAKTRQLLDNHKVSNVDLRVAPLTPHTSGVSWYDSSALSDLAEIDLLFIDGPPATEDGQARHPALDELVKKLSPKAIVVLDDAGRDGEKELAQKFAAALPNHVLEFLNHEKGTAVIRPK